MLFEALVTSAARRRILRLLVGEGASGSTAELAERARIGFASAYRELHGLAREGFASSTRQGRTQVFAANKSHPLYNAVHALVTAKQASPTDEAEDNATRNALFTLGAPTFGEQVQVDDPNRALVDGVALSHRDGTVASILPIVFWRQRERLDPDRLLDYARQLDEKRALGFYLDLTAEVSGEKRFADWAKRLRDGRAIRVHYFFANDDRSELSRKITELATPKVARRWNLRMNTSFGTFKSTFEKHTGHVAA